MQIIEIAPDVLGISLQPFNGLNTYLINDILIDSGPRSDAKKLLKLLEGRSLTAHVITHGHFDHQGCSHAVCQAFNIPLWCGAGDRAAIEKGDMKSITRGADRGMAWFETLLIGPPHPVARLLHEGDLVGGFQVLEAPGHTPGHLAFWRERNRVLILGDVLFNRNPLTLQPGLREPFRIATFDVNQNRASIHKLAALKPEVVCFGHGRPLRDMDRFQKFVENLPS